MDEPSAPRSSLIDDLQYDLSRGHVEEALFTVGDPAILGSMALALLLSMEERDRESATTESVQFAEEVLSDVDVFRKDLDVEGAGVPMPWLPRRLFVNELQSTDASRHSSYVSRQAVSDEFHPQVHARSVPSRLRALMKKIGAQVLTLKRS